MAITIIQPLVAASIAGGFDIPMQLYTQAASSTFKVGALLSPSGGDLVEATDASPTTSIAGISLVPGTNVAGAHQSDFADSNTNAVRVPILMVPAHPGVVYEGTFANAGADVALAATDLFVKYGLSKDTTSGFWYVDKSKTVAGASVIVISYKPKADVVLGTTTGARVYFKFLASVTVY